MFKQQFISIGSCLIFFSIFNLQAHAAKPPAAKINKNQLIEELTGKTAAQRVPTASELKSRPLSTQHYFAGIRAMNAKDYIKAIQHFNTVLKKYPQSKETTLAFKAKAKVYTEMGLFDQARHNLARSNATSRLQINPMTAQLNAQQPKVQTKTTKNSAADTQKRVNR